MSFEEENKGPPICLCDWQGKGSILELVCMAEHWEGWLWHFSIDSFVLFPVSAE